MKGHTEYIKRLTPEDRVLITLRDELYESSWDKMLKDLKDRMRGRPYIFKLVSRIKEDIARIEQLQTYEQKHKINLAEYLQQEEKENSKGQNN
jgi:hypothetical protein